MERLNDFNMDSKEDCKESPDDFAISHELNIALLTDLYSLRSVVIESSIKIRLAEYKISYRNLDTYLSLVLISIRTSEAHINMSPVNG